MANPKNLRATMPQTAAWIDALRTFFGADQIDPSIRAGMKGGTAFRACENGHEIGGKDVRVGIALAQCVLNPTDAAEFSSARNARREK